MRVRSPVLSRASEAERPFHEIPWLEKMSVCSGRTRGYKSACARRR